MRYFIKNLFWRVIIKLKKIYLFISLTIVLLSSLALYGVKNKPDKILNIAYLNQKYPYFYVKNPNIKDKDRWDNFNGFEYVIINNFANKYGFTINLELYEKSKTYDIIIGGIIYSKQIEYIFHLYDFVQYLEDSIIVLCLAKNNYNLESFKSAKDEEIGFLMYSYSYYLMKQYFPQSKIYAYEEDIVKDLLSSKIQFIVVDKNFFRVPQSYEDQIKSIGEIYKEIFGILILKSRADLKEILSKIISGLDFEEILRWLK